MLYKINNGAVTVAGKTILEEINFVIHEHDKIGIVGRNGCGKTTLFKAIMGEIPLEAGIGSEDFCVNKIGNFKIGYFSQNVICDDSMSMMEYILMAYKDLIDIENNIKKLEGILENNYSDDVLEKYNSLLYQYKYMGGYNYKKEYELALKKFGFTNDDKYKKINEFSGGQRTKLAFIRLLLSKPDLLLLDEPTNHLDIKAIIWLEEYLKNYPKSVVVVSHDRMFLDNVCNVIYEIEYGSLSRYVGNYSSYLKQKKSNYDKVLKDYKIQQTEIERLKRIADRFRYKPSKASMAMSKLKQIEHMTKIEKPISENLRIFRAMFKPDIDSYRDVLKVKKLGVGYDKVINYVSLNVEKGNKIGIIGDNGIGKSTFLKTLVGKISPLSGKFVFGKRVNIGYFDQSMDDLCLENTVYDELDKMASEMSPKDIRNILGAFEFRGDDVFKKVSDLSGGEKVRLSLCKIFFHKPNLLILDEPTNHLDIISKETIQNMLEAYEGTIVMVSHDRYLINSVCDSILLFKRGEVLYYPYGYSDEMFLDNDNDSKEESLQNKSLKKEKYVSPLKEKRRLERKLEKLEKEITDLENKISLKNKEFFNEDVYLDSDNVKKLQGEIDALNVMLDDKTKEWEEILILVEK